MSHDTPPMPTVPPPPPEPKRSRTNLVIIGSALAVIAAIITTGVVVANTRDEQPEASATESSQPADDTVIASEEPTPTPTDTGPAVGSLTDGVRWDGGIEAELSGWTRGVTGPYAAPADTPYVKFTVKFTNGGDQTVDLSGAYLTCLYGSDGRQSAQVFDSERGLEGLPLVHLRPGKSVSAVTGCELPEGEKYLQVELAATHETETAIFAGNVK